MDEHEAGMREILREYLRGTPIEGDEGEIDRLMELDALMQSTAVGIIVGGEADTVDAAHADYRWRSKFLRDVQEDIDNL